MVLKASEIPIKEIMWFVSKKKKTMNISAKKKNSLTDMSKVIEHMMLKKPTARGGGHHCPPPRAARTQLLECFNQRKANFLLIRNLFYLTI